MVESSVAEVEPKRTVAPSVFNHYWQRFTWFTLDALILGASWVLLIGILGLIHFASGNSSAWKYFQFEVSIPVIVGAFFLEYFRNRSDFAWTGMMVVTKDCVRVSRSRAAVRSLAYMCTWLLLPLNLVFIAVGSRRLLHDYIAGTHVISEGEDLKTSFYPPARSWVAPLLVVGCVALACLSGQVSQVLLRTEFELVPAILGNESKNYLTYLKLRFNQNPQILEYLSEDEAQQLMIQYTCLHYLQQHYYGDRSEESVRILYCAALVAVAAKDRDMTDALVYDLLMSDPDVFAKVARGSYDYGMHQFATQNLAVACMYSRAGRPLESSHFAEVEKQSAALSGDNPMYVECCQILERDYRELSVCMKGPDGEKYRTLAEQQHEDLKRILITKI